MDKAEAGQQSFLQDVSTAVTQKVPGDKWDVNIVDPEQCALLITYGLMGPFIGYPGWGDDPQFWKPHKDKITLLRLAHAMEIARTGMALEYETMLYLSSASLVGPMSHGWANIYMYLFRRCMPKETADAVGANVKELKGSHKEDLEHLRRWIFKHQMEHLKSKLGDTPRESAVIQGKFF